MNNQLECHTLNELKAIQAQLTEAQDRLLRLQHQQPADLVTRQPFVDWRMSLGQIRLAINSKCSDIWLKGAQ